MHLRCRAKGRHVQQIIVSGDFFVTPPRLIYDLECALKDIPVNAVASTIDEFFAGRDIGLMSFEVADLREVVNRALHAQTDSVVAGSAGRAAADG